MKRSECEHRSDEEETMNSFEISEDAIHNVPRVNRARVAALTTVVVIMLGLKSRLRCCYQYLRRIYGSSHSQQMRTGTAANRIELGL